LYRDAHLSNLPLVNAGGIGRLVLGVGGLEVIGGMSSTIPSSIVNLRKTTVLNFGKCINHRLIKANSFPHLISIVAKHRSEFIIRKHSKRDWKDGTIDWSFFE